jgi:hypothetical protein
VEIVNVTAQTPLLSGSITPNRPEDGNDASHWSMPATDGRPLQLRPERLQRCRVPSSWQSYQHITTHHGRMGVWQGHGRPKTRRVNPGTGQWQDLSTCDLVQWHKHGTRSEEPPGRLTRAFPHYRTPSS